MPLGELEGRTDATRQRVWIVDKETGEVIATLDRSSNTVTGLRDKPPAWATMEGGVVLNETMPDVRQE
jgi:hypothetical protein